MAERTKCVCENSLQQSDEHTRACPEPVCEGNTFDGRENKVCQRRESERLLTKTVRRFGILGETEKKRRPKRIESECKRERKERKENEKI